MLASTGPEVASQTRDTFANGDSARSFSERRSAAKSFIHCSASALEYLPLDDTRPAVEQRRDVSADALGRAVDQNLRAPLHGLGGVSEDVGICVGIRRVCVGGYHLKVRHLAPLLDAKPQVQARLP